MNSPICNLIVFTRRTHLIKTEPKLVNKVSQAINIMLSLYLKCWETVVCLSYFCTNLSKLQQKWLGALGWIKRGLVCVHNYRLNWTRRTSWGLWDEWDNTDLQTQDSKFDTVFEIRTLAIWGRTRCLSITDATHNMNLHEEISRFFETWMPELGTNPQLVPSRLHQGPSLVHLIINFFSEGTVLQILKSNDGYRTERNEIFIMAVDT